MSDDPLFEKLQLETQPELDRIRAEHERFMQLVAQMPELSEAQKRAIAETNSPEGWQQAIAEVMGDGRPKHRKAKYWLLVGVIVVAAVSGIVAIFKLM